MQINLCFVVIIVIICCNPGVVIRYFMVAFKDFRQYQLPSISVNSCFLVVQMPNTVRKSVEEFDGVRRERVNLS